MKKAVLQVALDVLELKRALQIAQESLDGGADWIEVGTPLIKSEGMQAVRLMRDRFPDTTLVADMKVADTGTLEVEMAAKDRCQYRLCACRCRRLGNCRGPAGFPSLWNTGNG